MAERSRPSVLKVPARAYFFKSEDNYKGMKDVSAMVEEAWNHRGMVRNLIRRRLPNLDDVDDAEQDSYLKLIRNAERYTPTKSFKAWMSSIADHIAIDVLRKQRRSLTVENVGYELPARDGSPYEYAMKEELREKVREAIQKLPEKYKRAIELRFFEELTFGDGAKRLGIPEGTLPSRVYTALALLERRLADYSRP